MIVLTETKAGLPSTATAAVIAASSSARSFPSETDDVAHPNAS